MLTRTFFQANPGQDGNQDSTLALRPLCSVLPQTVLHVTITSELAGSLKVFLEGSGVLTR
jgi:hypothetical protein